MKMLLSLYKTIEMFLCVVYFYESDYEYEYEYENR